jgi:hypothetical protein
VEDMAFCFSFLLDLEESKEAGIWENLHASENTEAKETNQKFESSGKTIPGQIK